MTHAMSRFFLGVGFSLFSFWVMFLPRSVCGFPIFVGKLLRLRRNQWSTERRGKPKEEKGFVGFAYFYFKSTNLFSLVAFGRRKKFVPLSCNWQERWILKELVHVGTFDDGNLTRLCLEISDFLWLLLYIAIQRA